MDILSFALGKKIGKSSVKLQEKTVTPSDSEIIVTPDVGFDALSQVIVEAMSNSGDGGTWVRRSGNFTPTSTIKFGVSHSLGQVPDVVIATANVTGVFPASDDKPYAIGAFLISERVFGDATGSGEKRYGNSISYNPSAKGFIIGDFTSGLETAAGYGIWFVSGCDATTLKFGGNMAYLVCDGSTTYSWAAYAKK